jgi:CRP-like cAMP-binding protein
MMSMGFESNRQSEPPAVPDATGHTTERRVMSAALAHHSFAPREALLRGKKEFLANFADGPAISLRAGKKFPPATPDHDRVYRLQAGWACQYAQLSEDKRVIVDIYLPGDFIGLDAALKIRPVENVLALTSIGTQTANARILLRKTIASPSTMLFVAWLLAHRQQRSDRLLAAISGSGARGRIATMMLDLYQRLRMRKLITTNTFLLPLTQQHIGEYLGLTVVHVNRVLKSLRADRIAQLERHCLTILDMQRLILLSRRHALGNVASDVGRREAPRSGASHADYAKNDIRSSMTETGLSQASPVQDF